MKLNEKLQMLRKEKGLSQEALAYELGVSRQAVSKWESGQVYPETEKLILLGKLFSVSMDYLLNEEKEEKEKTIAESVEECRIYSMEEIQTIITWRQKFGYIIAGGVALILCGLSFPLLFASRQSHLGAALFLIIVGIAVMIFIAAGISDHQRCQDLEQRIYVKKSDVEQLKQQFQNFRPQFTAKITAGVFLCIMGPVSVLLLETVWGEQEPNAIGLFFFVALALLLLIPAGVMYSIYQRFICFEKENQEKQKARSESRYGFVYAVLMPLASLFYIYDGMKSNSWGSNWIIFPVAAIVSTGIVKILEYRHQIHSEKENNKG